MAVDIIVKLWTFKGQIYNGCGSSMYMYRFEQCCENAFLHFFTRDDDSECHLTLSQTTPHVCPSYYQKVITLIFFDKSFKVKQTNISILIQNKMDGPFYHIQYYLIR